MGSWLKVGLHTRNPASTKYQGFSPPWQNVSHRCCVLSPCPTLVTSVGATVRPGTVQAGLLQQWRCHPPATPSLGGHRSRHSPHTGFAPGPLSPHPSSHVPVSPAEAWPLRDEVGNTAYSLSPSSPRPLLYPSHNVVLPWACTLTPSMILWCLQSNARTPQP